MATATAQIPEVKARIADRVADACDTKHLAHEARRLQTVAQDAIEDGVYAAKRALKTVRRRVEDLGDIKENVVHRMRREPVKAAGIALGIGVALGVGVAWFATRSRRHE